MLAQVLDLFEISPEYDLQLMSENQTLEHLAAQVLTKLPRVLEQAVPHALVIQGDTSTALYAALCGFYRKLTVVHVEAGLRSFDKLNPFPEEINRKLITAAADIHLAPTQINMQNLTGEGIKRESIFVSGNTVIDALQSALSRSPAVQDKELAGLLTNRTRRKVLITAHRRENFGEPLRNICEAILELATKNPEIDFIYPVHKNPNVTEPVNRLLPGQKNIHLLPPVNYADLVIAMNSSHLILTDSGGIQEEAPSLGKPVLVLRDTTERPEAVSAGTVKLVGTEKTEIVSAATTLLTDPEKYRAMSRAVNPYGDGRASERIVQFLKFRFGFTTEVPAEFHVTGA